MRFFPARTGQGNFRITSHQRPTRLHAPGYLNTVSLLATQAFHMVTPADAHDARSVLRRTSDGGKRLRQTTGKSLPLGSSPLDSWPDWYVKRPNIRRRPKRNSRCDSSTRPPDRCYARGKKKQGMGKSTREGRAPGSRPITDPLPPHHTAPIDAQPLLSGGDALWETVPGGTGHPLEQHDGSMSRHCHHNTPLQ